MVILAEGRLDAPAAAAGGSNAFSFSPSAGAVDKDEQQQQQREGGEAAAAGELEVDHLSRSLNDTIQSDEFFQEDWASPSGSPRQQDDLNGRYDAM